MSNDTSDDLSEVERAVRQAQRHASAPAIMKKVANENDWGALAELAAEIETTAREEAQDRDLGRHATVGALYMVVDRLGEEGIRQAEGDDDE